jgi:hypothetical protein
MQNAFEMAAGCWRYDLNSLFSFKLPLALARGSSQNIRGFNPSIYFG